MIGEAFDSLHPLPPSPTPLQPSHKGGVAAVFVEVGRGRDRIRTNTIPNNFFFNPL